MENFIYGVLFLGIGVPIISGIQHLIEQVVEVICAFMAVKVCQYNEIINAASAEEEPPANKIGFCIDDPDLEEEEDNDEE